MEYPDIPLHDRKVLEANMKDGFGTLMEDSVVIDRRALRTIHIPAADVLHKAVNELSFELALEFRKRHTTQRIDQEKDEIVYECHAIAITRQQFRKILNAAYFLGKQSNAQPS